MSVGTRGSGTEYSLQLDSGATAPVSDANAVAFRYNTALSRAEFSTNGGPYVPLAAGAGQLIFANIAAMGVYADALLDDGAECVVATLMANWKLIRSSVDVPDGITIVAANSGVGNWHRAESYSSHWLAQKNWWITDVTGDDEADGGTAVTPIKSWDELRRRLGTALGECGLITITLDGVAGQFTQDMVIDFVTERGPTVGVNAIAIQGTLTPLYSGSVTGRTVWNSVAGTRTTITDAAIPASWTASGLVKQLLVMTSGPNVGLGNFIVADLGAKTCELAQLYDNAAGVGGLEPAVGETFDVFSVTELIGSVSIESSMSRIWMMQLKLTPFMFPPDNNDVVCSASSIYFGWCHLDTPHLEFHGGIMDFFGCLLDGGGGQDLFAGRYRMGWSAIITDTLQIHTGAEFDLSDNSILRAGALWVGPGGGYLGIGSDGGTLAVMACDGATALRVHSGGVLEVETTLFGAGNASAHVLTVQNGGTVKWKAGSVLPTAAGAVTADASVGGTDRTWAQAFAGYANLTNLASCEVAAE